MKQEEEKTTAENIFECARVGMTKQDTIKFCSLNTDEAGRLLNTEGSNEFSWYEKGKITGEKDVLTGLQNEATKGKSEALATKEQINLKRNIDTELKTRFGI